MNASQDIAVLMYHGLHDGPDDPGAHDPVYSVTPTRFCQQLERIRRLNLDTLTDDDIDAGGRGGVMLTFDDGDRTNHVTALPLLQQRNLRATFFITTDWIDDPQYLTPTMIRELHAAGMSIGSHGCSHRYLSGLDDRELDAELVHSKARLEDIIGAPVTSLSLPGGRGGRRAVAAARRRGYRRVYGSRLGHYTGSQALIPRIPIDSKTSADDLEAMLLRQGPWWRRRARQWLLDSAKTLMGDPLYDRLRNALLRS